MPSSMSSFVQQRRSFGIAICVLLALTMWFATLLTTANVAYAATEDLSRGFSDKIAWVPGLDKAKEMAKAENKPIVVLVHKTWCGACKHLKGDFQAGGPSVDRVIKASKNYVMVNLQDDESTGKKELEPEGAGYIPRAIFLDSDGKTRADIKSTANPKYAYFYPTAASLADVMEGALSQLQTKNSEL